MGNTAHRIRLIVALLLLLSHSVVSDSSRPHGLQPTSLLRPWDFPGKSTGVGCHCLLLIVAQWFPNLFTHWSHWGTSVHLCLYPTGLGLGIFYSV